MDISTKVAKKFMADTKIKTKNTIVEVSSDNHVRMYLFGNLIAVKYEREYYVQINNCGYTTKTTKSRLNAILSELNFPFSIVQIKNKWYKIIRDKQTRKIISQVEFPNNKWVGVSS